MTEEYDKVAAAAAALEKTGARPEALVILGTGLGGLGDKLEDPVAVPYEAIPQFPRSTSPGHSGRLIFGNHAGTAVMVMEGRFHHYEGYSLTQVVRPVRVARALGAATLFVTSAVGGLNPHYTAGEIVVIDDHINLIGSSPLRGPNDDRIGPRFPDMSAPYDRTLVARAESLALEMGGKLPRATLVAVGGPQLETRAEYRFLRRLGADVVGMSTVPECIAAVHAGLKVCALSVVTDMCLPDALQPAVVEEIIATANRAAPRLEKLLSGLLQHG